MQTVLAYTWTPAVICLVAIGLGLLCERVARRRLPAGLLAPAGLALAISLSMAVFRLDGPGWVAAAVLAACAVAGLVLARRDLRARL
ncbi:MAG: hypothetical protein AVDCRST_MAG30-1593, partial [uncultured Solirubrobacteraceae bacterium]